MRTFAREEVWNGGFFLFGLFLRLSFIDVIARKTIFTVKNPMNRLTNEDVFDILTDRVLRWRGDRLIPVYTKLKLCQARLYKENNNVYIPME